MFAGSFLDAYTFIIVYRISTCKARLDMIGINKGKCLHSERLGIESKFPEEWFPLWDRENVWWLSVCQYEKIQRETRSYRARA